MNPKYILFDDKQDSYNIMLRHYIIITGLKHYALYRVKGIKTRTHVHNLNIKDYDNRLQAKIEFKRLLESLHGEKSFSIEFKG